MPEEPAANVELHPQDVIQEAPKQNESFVKFYGLYWQRNQVDWGSGQLLGAPKGWLGKGKVDEQERPQLQMNFWSQKGIYLLYDRLLTPIYAGQAGLERGVGAGGRTVGDRLSEHARKSYFMNAWDNFTWFGFLETPQMALRNAEEDQRMNVAWTKPNPAQDNSFNLLLASFEAVLIEGFTPRFNARGGDLKKACVVSQFRQD